MLTDQEEREYEGLGQLLLAHCYSRSDVLPAKLQARSELLFVRCVEASKERGERLDEFLGRFPPTVAETLAAVIAMHGGVAPTS